MVDFTDIPTADDAMRRALIENWATLPNDEREALFALGSMSVSPVDRLVKSAEIIYGAHEAMPKAVKDAAAGMFKLGTLYGFHSLGVDQRGINAAKVLEGKQIAEKDRPVKRDDLLPRKEPEQIIPVIVPDHPQE